MDISKNYFQLFGFPVQFSIDEPELSKRYRELQKDIHPDRFAGKGDREKRLAEQFSTYVNEAYQGLMVPLARAEYLLVLAGVEMDPQNETTNDGLFLMQQMELREALAEVPSHENPEAALDEMSAQVKQSIELLLQEYETAYNAGLFDQCKASVTKLHFVTKLSREIEKLEAQILDY